MNYEDFELAILEMLYSPYGPNGKEEPIINSNKQEPSRDYILEYCNEYSLESAPETIYHEWIQLLEGNDAIILEICLEPYMRIIERVTNKVVSEHPIQRKVINIEGE